MHPSDVAQVAQQTEPKILPSGNWFLDHIWNAGTHIDPEQTLVTLCFATLYSYFIAFTYRKTYQGTDYNRNFAQSVVILGVLVSLVIAIIGNSIARAFGVFGALTIIRYRVPMRDPKDIVFILASVVVGMACGVKEYPEAGLATLFVVALVVAMYWSSLGLGPAPQPEEKGKKDKKKKKHKGEAAMGVVPTPPGSEPGKPPLTDEDLGKKNKHKNKLPDDE